MIKENISLFHFFAWCDSYGWQHLGRTDGYNSYKKCYDDNIYYIEGSKCFEDKLLNGKREKWKIMKLEECKKR